MAGPIEIATPQGPARAHLRPVRDPRAWLLLGHGAGGSIDAPDLRTATAAAHAARAGVVLVEQPYRVAGKRSVPPPPKLDEAWLAVVARLRDGDLGGAPLIFGGRSSGARVACRTARQAGARGALCLAFPLLAPRRSGPPASRQDELDGAGVPVLVVQGVRDRFGMPEPRPDRTVAQVEGDHGLKGDQAAIGDAVSAWLTALLE